MTELAIFTIVSNNYLHFARTLLQSARLHHPEALCYCVIVDTDPAYARALSDEFETITLDQLALPNGEDFLFQYNVLELNTAVKPWALQHLIERGHQKVCYIDPDIQIHAPLREVQGLLDGGADLVFTPHLLAPLTDTYRPNELDIRRAGTYNLGFCAMKAGVNTLDYLRWWQGKLVHDCINAQDRGIFVDQSWVDLAPGLFPNVAVLRHPGYNVAYWNLAQRELTQHEGKWRVNGQPLVFFHFSGLDPQNPQQFSKHQNRFNLDNVGDAPKALILHYSQCVVANGVGRYSSEPYGFGKYTDGTPITEVERSRFRTNAGLRRACEGKPFSRPDLIASDKSTSGELHHTAGGRRLLRIYRDLLGRPPDASAIHAYANHCESRTGTVRTLLAVALSSEARDTPGWAGRLLGLVGQAQPTPNWLKRFAIAPLLKLATGPYEPVQQAAARSVLLETAVAGASHAVKPLPERRRGALLVPIERLPAPSGINLVGYLAAELGVGEAARSLARACVAAGVPFSGVDVGYQSQNAQRDTSVLAQASADRFAIDLLYVNADQTPATAHKLVADNLTNEYAIGFWHWEQPQLPARWLGAFDHVDEVWVPSTFVHDAIAAVAPVPVVKIPHALQFAPSADAQRGRFGLPQDKLLALVMYDFHSYQYRKNPQAAVASYRQAARGRPHLGLVIKTMNSQHHAAAYAELRASVQDLPNVIFIDDVFTRQQTWDLQSCCDILISLHRAEGFGLVPAEMMYLGKPVVATGWSANMDFMNANNSMPVRYQLRALANDVGVYLAGPLWAEADVDHAAWCLGRLADAPELAQGLGEQAARDIRQQLSPAAVGQQIRRRLQILGHWHPRLLAAPRRPELLVDNAAST